LTRDKTQSTTSARENDETIFTNTKVSNEDLCIVAGFFQKLLTRGIKIAVNRDYRVEPC